VFPYTFEDFEINEQNQSQQEDGKGTKDNDDEEHLVAFEIAGVLFVVLDVCLNEVNHDLPEELFRHEDSIHLMVGVFEEVLVVQHVPRQFLHRRRVQNVNVVLVELRTPRVCAQVLKTYFPQLLFELRKLCVIYLFERSDAVVRVLEQFVRSVKGIVVVSELRAPVFCQESVDQSGEKQWLVHPVHDVFRTLSFIDFSHLYIHHVVESLQSHNGDYQDQWHHDEPFVGSSQLDWEFLCLQLLSLDIHVHVHVRSYRVSSRHVTDQVSTGAFTCRELAQLDFFPKVFAENCVG
jgi:hypothetical protein